MSGINAPNGNLDSAQIVLPAWVRETQAKLAALRSDVNRSAQERNRIEQLDQAFGDTIAQVNSALTSGDQNTAGALMQSAAELVVDIEQIQVVEPTRNKLAALRGALPPMPATMSA